ncbi:membrane protein [Rhodococcus ruber Chol-4]|uniref:membrane protein n=1 Tax=Rhodococcus ruber TaxID=1830 RepID=UPI0003462395|nr:membrane protein [Rhodococcus ruber]AWG98949.1 hypothetical protein DCN13_10420 [Rhodococcus ruber]KXF86427.1 membrane protein [Rhodococcus ruber Chol-4]RQM32361.1 hypothetical protein TN91_21010 [Rhodococcus ruber]
MRGALVALVVATVSSPAAAAQTTAPVAAAQTTAPAATAQTTAPAAEVDGSVLCTPADPALAELSGLAVAGGRLFAVPDAGADEAVFELGDDCAVLRRIPPAVDPYDVEDLAAGPDGRLWLGDLGDNRAARDTVALISVDPQTGAGSLHRLAYPDGPRDAETLLVPRDGVPLIVSKPLFGSAGLYRPAGGRSVDELPEPGPVPLERIGTVTLGPTDTPGGPVGGASSTLITGGAISPDGTVAAVRTYTDVHLFHAPDGDVAAALAAGPSLRVPVPGEPQGEAVAFTADGDLLTASESVGGALPPVRVWRDVVTLFRPVAAPEPVRTPRGAMPAAIAAGIVVVAAAAGGLWRRSSRRRRG